MSHFDTQLERLVGLAAMVLLVLVGAAGARPAHAAALRPPDARSWLGPDGDPLPFASDQEAESFLREARVVSSAVLGSGTSRPRRLVLERDGVTARAIFRTVDTNAFNINQRATRENLMTDSFVNEVAAYRLSRLLGLDTVPPTVLREIDGVRGSVQLWIENARTQEELTAAGATHENPYLWVMQERMILVWDELISNWDRNTTNLLVDGNGRLWYIDHTRAFRRITTMDYLDQITVCERHLWDALKVLDEDAVRLELSPYLEDAQIVALLKRHGLLLRHIEDLVHLRGESGVLYDLADAARLLAAQRTSGG